VPPMLCWWSDTARAAAVEETLPDKCAQICSMGARWQGRDACCKNTISCGRGLLHGWLWQAVVKTPQM